MRTSLNQPVRESRDEATTIFTLWCCRMYMTTKKCLQRLKVRKELQFCHLFFDIQFFIGSESQGQISPSISFFICSLVGFLLGVSSCVRPKLRVQNLRPLRPLYKRARKIIMFFFFFFFFQFFTATGGRRKERDRGEPPFLKLERKIQFILHCPDFIKGPILLRLWVDRPKIWIRDS